MDGFWSKVLTELKEVSLPKLLIYAAFGLVGFLVGGGGSAIIALLW